VRPDVTTPDWAAAALAEYRAGRPLALLFDYDGTLAPLAPHPSLAALPAATRDALAALAELPRVAVGVVPGPPACGHVRLGGQPGVRDGG
jgi:trehalose-phosphatase